MIAKSAEGAAAVPLLVLWDIDQTLIEGAGVSRAAYDAAFRRLTGGRSIERPWAFDGRTELANAAAVLRDHGVDPEREGNLEEFVRLVVDELHARADVLAKEGYVLPGAGEALAAVAAIGGGVTQSVLTGNLYPLAVLKMTVFGLARHLDFRVGAYGGDAVERDELSAYAFDRTARYLGRRHSGADTVIIGDTRRDVAAARAAGARAVAVATGRTGAEELAAAGADVVLADLSDTGAVLAAIGVA
ncbi:HAD hydrolase-like protein [Streptomyces boninensis]|uniref:HAD hydrolase-like protein n=1 Tax=Streptomyces boninensis TaxID=2039455 RepID=UPI003B2225DB